MRRGPAPFRGGGNLIAYLAAGERELCQGVTGEKGGLDWTAITGVDHCPEGGPLTNGNRRGETNTAWSRIHGEIRAICQRERKKKNEHRKERGAAGHSGVNRKKKTTFEQGGRQRMCRFRGRGATATLCARKGMRGEKWLAAYSRWAGYQGGAKKTLT